MNYQRKTLPSTAVGEPGPLPADLVGLDDATLADLSVHLDQDACAELGYAGEGFFRVADPELPRYVPAEVPMYKVRKLLIKQGLLATVEAALGTLPGEAGALAMVDWEYAPNLVRSSALVQGMGAIIGLTSDEIDDLVIAANAIP